MFAILAACTSRPSTDTDKKSEKKEAKTEGHEHGGTEHVTVSAEQQRANRFDFAAAEERSLARVIETTGSVGPNESRMARLRPLGRGRILSVKVRIGDTVRKGDELLAYDNIELGEAVAQYVRMNAQVDRARTEAAVAHRALERAKNLVALGGIARNELDKREADALKAEAVVAAEVADQSLWTEKLYRFGMSRRDIQDLTAKNTSQSHRELSAMLIRAPFDGVVLQVNTAEGETVQPDTQLFEIADTSTVWVQADLYERELGAVRRGESVVVMLEAYPGERFSGRITHIADTIDPSSRTAKIRCEVANPDRRLKLSMFATILIPGRGERRALMIPSGALQQLEGRSVVFVREEENGPFEIRTVRAGTEISGWTEIESGLKAGETVVNRGSFVLKAEHLKGELGEAGHSHD